MIFTSEIFFCVKLWIMAKDCLFRIYSLKVSDVFPLSKWAGRLFRVDGSLTGICCSEEILFPLPERLLYQNSGKGDFSNGFFREEFAETLFQTDDAAVFLCKLQQFFIRFLPEDPDGRKNRRMKPEISSPGQDDVQFRTADFRRTEKFFIQDFIRNRILNQSLSGKTPCSVDFCADFFSVLSAFPCPNSKNVCREVTG